VLRIQKKVYLWLLIVTLSQADDFYNTMSMQGPTGVINTPNAEIIETELVEFQFSNQIDYTRVHVTKKELIADQYFVNIGMFQNIELIGRLANIEYRDESKYNSWTGGIHRDLAASFKYQIPFYHEYLPKVAIGIQDLGGQASHYDSKYIVATKEYNFLRGSVGYGFDSINVLDGTVGSLDGRETD